MIFDCGEDHEHYVERIKDWHSFFTILPRTVKIENGRNICAWMQIIERRCLRHYCWPDGCGTFWEYRLKEPAK